MHALQVGQQVVAHLVLDLARGIEDPPAAEPAKHVLSGGQADHEQRELPDEVELGSGREGVDDAANQQRRQHGYERAERHEQDAGREPELVLSEVMEQGGARRPHWRPQFT